MSKLYITLKNGAIFMLKIKKKFFAFLYVSVLLVYCCITFSIQAITDTTTVVSVAELYDTTAGSISRDNLDVLYNLLTGLPSATLEDVNNLGIQTSADIRDKNDGKDIVVTFGGYDWTVTYLTEDRSGNLVCDLWLANTSETSVYNHFTSKSTAVSYPSNMYGTSYIRVVTLNSGGHYATSNTTAEESEQSVDNPYAKFTMADIEDSLTSFIVQPRYIAYQETESANDIAPYSSSNYNMANDAYGEPVNPHWYTSSNNYLTVDSAKEDYVLWQDDYIWIPSTTELGTGDGVRGLWKTSTSQRKNTVITWTRSGSRTTGYGGGLQHIPANGVFSSTGVQTMTSLYAARPALHLNLTAAETSASTTLPVPQNVEVEYDGTSKSLADITPKPSWYKENFYTDSTKISITYTPAVMIDSGKYEATITVLDSELSWQGEPDTSRGETDTTRRFTFTINPKKIALKALALDDSGLPAMPQLADVSDINSRDNLPTLGYRYVSTDGKGYNSTTPPATVGSYKATACILDETSNYILDSTYEISFEVNKREIDIPWLNGTTAEYDGQIHSFALLNYASSDVRASAEGMKFENGVFSATDAGSYTVILSLADNGENTQWTDGTIGSQRITVTISQRKLNITIVNSLNAWQWQMNTEGSIEIHEDSLDRDTIVLNAYYYNVNTPTKKITVSSLFSTSDMDKGNYALRVELDTTIAGNANYCLEEEVIQEFTVIGIGASCDSVLWQYTNQGITTTIREEDLVDGVFRIPYTGGKYTFSIVTSDLALNGVKIHTDCTLTDYINGYKGIAATDSGSYTASVCITALNDSYTYLDRQFSIPYVIEKAVYDLSQVKWNYTGLSYTGLRQAVELTGIPAGLTANYTGNSQINSGNYKAKVSFGVEDTDNYIVPVSTDETSYTGEFSFELEWTISKAQLPIVWNMTDAEDSTGHTYQLPAVSGQADKVEYRYYLSDIAETKLSEISPLDIIVTKDAVYYLVEAVVKEGFTQNYELVGDSVYWFMIQEVRIGVQVSIEENTSVYDGVAKKVRLRIEGASLAEDSFTVHWYKAGSKEEINAASGAGAYRILIQLKEEYAGDYYIEGTKEYDYSISKAVLNLENLKWNYTEPYEYQENRIYSVELENLPEYLQRIVRYTGTAEASAAGSYTAGFEFEGYDTENYAELVYPEGFQSELVWKISNTGSTAPEEPIDPSQPVGPDTPNDDILDKYPVWQIAVSAADILLTLLFIFQAVGYSKKKKRIEKNLGSTWYRTYSFFGLPAVFFSASFMGMSEEVWNILAAVLSGICIIALIVMLVCRSRCLAVEEEEKRRRDEELKIMMMGLMNGKNQASGTASAAVIREIVTEVVTSLIPAMQQLPPAASDEVNQQLLKNQEELLKKQEEQERLIQKLSKESPKEEGPAFADRLKSLSELQIYRYTKIREEILRYRVEDRMTNQYEVFIDEETRICWIGIVDGAVRLYLNNQKQGQKEIALDDLHKTVAETMDMHGVPLKNK